jgi:carbonic anhydrase
MKLIRKAEKTLSNNFLVIAVLFIGLMTVFSTQVLAAETKPHWSYGGAGNPTQWGQIISH